ncbi:MT-A70-domain-containing protein [Meredithblackwellia eburnea MCA 4105]
MSHGHQPSKPATTFRTTTAQRQGQPPSTRNFAHSSAGGVRPQPFIISSTQQHEQAQGGADQQRRTDAQTDTVANARLLDKPTKNKRENWGNSYVPEEDSIRNDYSNHYVRTGSRPQNHLRGADLEHRFAEYPKLSSLLQLKHSQLSIPTHSIPPTYLLSETTPLSLSSLAPNRFDVILLSPSPEVTFESLKALELGRIAASPGFVWLWVGSGQPGDGVGLERGRELISSWGYRRCEDIVWLKTNKNSPSTDLVRESSSLFTSTVEHCLMGIRGTVRRSNDPWFVHCNVDTDVIVWEGDDSDPNLKPPELQSVIENFCLGTRRLHLFGSPTSLRRGWVTMGPSFLSSSDGGELVEKYVRTIPGEEKDWRAQEFNKSFESVFGRAEEGEQEERVQDAEEEGDRPVSEKGRKWKGKRQGEEKEKEKVLTLLPFSEELDSLRPKSPPPRNGQPSSGGLGRGRGAGLGVTRSTAIPLGLGSGGRIRGRGRGNAYPPPVRQAPPPTPLGYPGQQPPFFNYGYGFPPSLPYSQVSFPLSPHSMGVPPPHPQNFPPAVYTLQPPHFQNQTYQFPQDPSTILYQQQILLQQQQHQYQQQLIYQQWLAATLAAGGGVFQGQGDTGRGQGDQPQQ